MCIRDSLFNSGYDLRLGTYYAPDGTNLTDSPIIRSQFQKAIGEQNLELKLNELAEDPKIQASLQEMYRDIRSGNRGDYDASDYYHNKQIEFWFRQARLAAWASIQNQPNIVRLKAQQQAKKVQKYRKLQKTTDNVQPILNMYK